MFDDHPCFDSDFGNGKAWRIFDTAQATWACRWRHFVPFSLPSGLIIAFASHDDELASKWRAYVRYCTTAEG